MSFTCRLKRTEQTINPELTPDPVLGRVDVTDSKGRLIFHKNVILNM